MKLSVDIGEGKHSVNFELKEDKKKMFRPLRAFSDCRSARTIALM